MKKRFLSLFMAVCLVTSLVGVSSVSAYAESTNHIYAHNAKAKAGDTVKMPFYATTTDSVACLTFAPDFDYTALATKGHMIRTKILPYFGKMPISNIDTATVMNWQTELMNYRNPKTNKPYSQTYLRQIHNQLSTIFNFAIRYYGLSRNPAQLCGSMGKQNAEKFDFWTYDEFQKFIQAAKDDINAYTIFNLFFYSGMRMGELLALTLMILTLINARFQLTKALPLLTANQQPKRQKQKRAIALLRCPFR